MASNKISIECVSKNFAIIGSVGVIIVIGASNEIFNLSSYFATSS